MPSRRERMVRHVVAIASVVLTVSVTVGAQSLPRLQISENRRFFVTADGRPFFYMADTAWALFTLSNEDAETYLTTRADQKFTVIHAVIGHWTGLNRSHPDGEPMFVNGDTSKPNDRFFEHVDWVLARAEAHGLYVAVVPFWSRTHLTQQRSIFTDESLKGFGEYIGRRYRDRTNIIWVLGGDWSPVGMEPIWRTMAAGIDLGEAGGPKHLKTYHPRSPESSSFWFHNDPWLDFNMLQTGHTVNNRNYELVDDDYDRHPIKPVIDGEPAYEDIDDRGVSGGRITAFDVRRQAYTAVLAGAAGHSYGADAVYGMRRGGPRGGWKDQVRFEGASQMQHLRNLIESRPMLVRIPDQWIIVNDPMSLADRIQASRASDGSYAFIYSASGRMIHVKMRHHGNDYLSGEKMKAWWYDPRTGEAKLIEEFDRRADNPGDQGRDDITRKFTPPTSGPGNDWVLVLDDSSKNYPSPGKKE